MVGVPWTDSQNPQAMAQFCAPYEVASVIKNRRFGPSEIRPERIAEDKDVDALARRCELHEWKDWGGSRPAFQAVRIFLKDGRKLEAWHNIEEVFSPRSNTYEQLVEKFTHNVKFTGLIDETQAGEIVKAIEGLDKYDNIGKFIHDYLVFEE
jgi:2-methylcitrate dehydratase PrpD